MRQRATDQDGSHFTSVTCLVCRLETYRVQIDDDVYHRSDSANVSQPADWVEPVPLQSKDGWVLVSNTAYVWLLLIMPLLLTTLSIVRFSSRTSDVLAALCCCLWIYHTRTAERPLSLRPRIRSLHIAIPHRQRQLSSIVSGPTVCSCAFRLSRN